MGLRDDIMADVKEAFDTDLSDAVKAITFKRGLNLYDANSGDVSVPAEMVSVSRGVVSEYTELDRQRGGSSIFDDDLKCLVIVNEVDPTAQIGGALIVGDYAEVDGKTFKIISIRPDEVNATQELQLR